MPTASERVAFSNISATTAGFVLTGGVYDIDCVATFGGGNVDFQELGPDGTTWLTHLAAAFTANGVKDNQSLPPGTYRFAITTATAVYCSVTRVPD